MLFKLLKPNLLYDYGKKDMYTNFEIVINMQIIQATVQNIHTFSKLPRFFFQQLIMRLFLMIDALTTGFYARIGI